MLSLAAKDLRQQQEGETEMVSFHTGDEPLGAPMSEWRGRCLACGRLFTREGLGLGLGPNRCGPCFSANRPVDLVMRWIWAEDDPRS